MGFRYKFSDASQPAAAHATIQIYHPQRLGRPLKHSSEIENQPLVADIALQSAVGGMKLNVISMIFAVTGHLTPVSGAITHEIIDVLAVLNALSAASPPKMIYDL